MSDEVYQELCQTTDVTGNDNDYSINNYCEVVCFLVSHGFYNHKNKGYDHNLQCDYKNAALYNAYTITRVNDSIQEQ